MIRKRSKLTFELKTLKIRGGYEIQGDYTSIVYWGLKIVVRGERCCLLEIRVTDEVAL